MNSFRTREDSLAVLSGYGDLGAGLGADFLQHKVPKIRADSLSPIDWPEAPELEWCPPGHGDIYTALVTSGMLEALLANSGALVATSIGTPRAVPPPEIAAAARRIGGADGPAVEVEEDPAAALARARDIAGADGLVVAVGSLYLVGRLLPLFEES